MCLKCMQDSNTQVVQMSYFALCQFSEYLQVLLSITKKKLKNILLIFSIL